MKRSVRCPLRMQVRALSSFDDLRKSATASASGLAVGGSCGLLNFGTGGPWEWPWWWDILLVLLLLLLLLGMLLFSEEEWKKEVGSKSFAS